MSEKKKWISPVTAVQRFAANDHVSSCWFHKIRAKMDLNLTDNRGDLYVYDAGANTPDYTTETERGWNGTVEYITGVNNASVLSTDRYVQAIDSKTGELRNNAGNNIVEADAMGYNEDGIYYANTQTFNGLNTQQGFFDEKGKDDYQSASNTLGYVSLNLGGFQYAGNVSFIDTGIERGYFEHDGYSGNHLAYISQRWIAATSFEILETAHMAGWYS